MARALVIDDAAKERANKVVAYAREHIYDPRNPGNIVPGNDPHFVAALQQGYRVVFSFTMGPDGHLFRHLSVSVDGSRYPSESAMGEIAALFGFTGWDLNEMSKLGFAKYVMGLGWVCGMNEEDHCIILAQRLEEDS